MKTGYPYAAAIIAAITLVAIGAVVGHDVDPAYRTRTVVEKVVTPTTPASCRAALADADEWRLRAVDLSRALAADYAGRHARSEDIAAGTPAKPGPDALVAEAECRRSR